MKKSSYRRRPKRSQTHSSNVSAARERRRTRAVAYDAEQRPSSTRADLAHDIGEPQRVVDEAPAPEDPRQARADQQLVAEHLVPEALHLVGLREEAVAAEIEAVAVAHDRSGEPADLLAGLEDDDRLARSHERVARGEPGGPGTEHGDRTVVAGGSHALWRLADDRV